MSSRPGTSHCKIILAGTIAKSVAVEVAEGIQELNRSPLLVGFLATSDPAARVYADWTAKTCKENGFQYELREVIKDDVEEAILAANADDVVDGIIVYYPIFGHRQDQYLQQIVKVGKDVEGLSHQYVFNLYQNIRYLDEQGMKKSILPCTPLAVVKILEHLQIYNTILGYGNRLHGRTITVINRSEVVGRPLAALLANDGANVYSVDISSVQQFHRGQGLKKRRHSVVEKPEWTMEHCLPLSDVVISGVPGDQFKVPLELLKDGAVCINISSEKNFTPEVKEKASIYVPAVGKVTIMVLLRNLLRIVHNRQVEAALLAPTTIAPTTIAPTTIAPTTIAPTTIALETVSTQTNGTASHSIQTNGLEAKIAEVKVTEPKIIEANVSKVPELVSFEVKPFEVKPLEANISHTNGASEGPK